MELLDILSKTVVGLAQAKKGLANFIDEEIAKHKHRQIERSQEARIELLKQLNELENLKDKDEFTQNIEKMLKQMLKQQKVSPSHVQLIDDMLESHESFKSVLSDLQIKSR
jgi:DNA-binding transcriptional regulator GbsR (MarR family)